MRQRRSRVPVNHDGYRTVAHRQRRPDDSTEESDRGEVRACALACRGLAAVGRLRRGRRRFRRIGMLVTGWRRVRRRWRSFHLGRRGIHCPRTARAVEHEREAQQNAQDRSHARYFTPDRDPGRKREVKWGHRRGRQGLGTPAGRRRGSGEPVVRGCVASSASPGPSAPARPHVPAQASILARSPDEGRSTARAVPGPASSRSRATARAG